MNSNRGPTMRATPQGPCQERCHSGGKGPAGTGARPATWTVAQLDLRDNDALRRRLSPEDSRPRLLGIGEPALDCP